MKSQSLLNILLILVLISGLVVKADTDDFTLEGAKKELKFSTRKFPPISLNEQPQDGTSIYIRIPNTTPVRFRVVSPDDEILPKVDLTAWSLRPTRCEVYDCQWLPHPISGGDGWWYLLRIKNTPSQPYRVLRIEYMGELNLILEMETALVGGRPPKVERLYDFQDPMIKCLQQKVQQIPQLVGHGQNSRVTAEPFSYATIHGDLTLLPRVDRETADEIHASLQEGCPQDGQQRQWLQGLAQKLNEQRDPNQLPEVSCAHERIFKEVSNDCIGGRRQSYH